jgi:DNA-binding NarL/FixJ family response regulator
METIAIFIVDDHLLIREGLKTTLKYYPHIKVLAEAANGQDCLELMGQFRPQVILMDVSMPLMDGYEATTKIRELFPEVEVVAFSMSDQESQIVKMMDAGAKGYMMKNAEPADIVSAIETVARHRNYFCQHTSRKLTQLVAASHYDMAQKKKRPDLNDKEISLMKAICREMTNKEIAADLNMSKRTVEGWRKRIIRKLNVKGTAGIVIYALANNMLTEEEKFAYKIVY